MTVQFAMFTPEEQTTVSHIIDRVILLRLYGENPDRLDVQMDISATHASCPLDLDRLLAFDGLNFAHDIGGIARNLDRTTGKLRKQFLPRSARSAKEKSNG